MTTPLMPLTTVEQRFWLWESLYPQATVAHLGSVVELRGAVDTEALQRAFDRAATAPGLRMRIVDEQGVYQGVLGDAVRLEVRDATNDNDVAAATDDIVRARYGMGNALVRGRLLRFSAERAVLVLGAHHAICDGYTFQRAWPKAIGLALRDELPAWDEQAWRAMRKKLVDERATDADRDFWRDKLRALHPVPYPPKKTPPAVQSGRGAQARIPIADDVMRGVVALATQHGAQPVHVWLALVLAEAARAGGSKDVLLATTSAHRQVDAAADGTDARSLGCFIKSHVLAAQVTPSSSFTELMAQARASVREGLAHSSLSLEDLSQLGDDAPTASVLLNYIPLPEFDDDLSGLVHSVKRLSLGSTTGRAAVSLRTEGGPQLGIDLDGDVFDTSDAERMGGRLLQMLQTALAEPATTLKALPRVLDADRAAHVKLQWTDASRAPVVGGTLQALLRKDFDVDWTTSRPALAHHDKIIARRELLQRGERIARHLRAQGIGPGSYVVLRVHDPLLVMQTIVGVVFAGAAWVPTDVAQPEERVASIIEACEATVVLSDVDVTRMLETSLDDTAPLPEPAGTDPVYAIFTSGSTGKPKGVVLSNNAVVGQFQGRVGLGFLPPKTYLNFAPFYFDGCIEALFWTLINGGTLYVLDENERKDPALVRRVLHEREITNTSAVPSLWSAVLDASDEPLTHLRFVIVGGEALTVPLVEKHAPLVPHARLINEYGPTESTVYSTWWEVPLSPPPKVISIGYSAPHVFCHVLDGFDQASPIGEPGELCVTGIGVADGYLRRPEETAKAFVKDLITEGEVGYRTGDLVRMSDDGTLEWLSRKDEMVKVRGVRIELGEVEAALAQLPGITEAAAAVRDKQLIAWLAPVVHTETEALALLATKLPPTMVPSRVVSLPVLPKSQNDKIDKKKLPSPEVDEQGVVAPNSDLERGLADIWRDVLKVDEVSVTSSFFAYGGDSLKATVVVTRARKQLGVEVPLSLFMTARTIRGIAEALRPAQAAESAKTSSLVIPLGAREAPSSPTVVFLPGIGGHVFTFTHIAEALRAPSVGLRTWGTEEGEAPLASIADVARKNIEQLDAAGLRDVVLAGYSFGATVAFEMALQLSRRGTPPRHVFLFDAFAPGYPAPLPRWQRVGLHVAAFLRGDGGGRVAYVKERLRVTRLKREQAKGEITTYLENVDDPLERRLQTLSGTSSLALLRYMPSSTTTIPTTLFVAEVAQQWAATVMDDPLYGWTTWLKGTLQRVPLAGDHLNLFSPDNLAKTAACIDAAALPKPSATGR